MSTISQLQYVRPESSIPEEYFVQTSNLSSATEAGHDPLATHAQDLIVWYLSERLIEIPIGHVAERLSGIQEQISDLSKLQDGWLDGDGKAPSKQGLSWLLFVFHVSFPYDAPLPRLYPTEQGNVQAEWRIKTRDMSLEVDLQKHLGDWHSLDLQSGDTVTGLINCDNDSDWQWVSDQLT